MRRACTGWPLGSRKWDHIHRRFDAISTNGAMAARTRKHGRVLWLSKAAFDVCFVLDSHKAFFFAIFAQHHTTNAPFTSYQQPCSHQNETRRNMSISQSQNGHGYQRTRVRHCRWSGTLIINVPTGLLIAFSPSLSLTLSSTTEFGPFVF